MKFDSVYDFFKYLIDNNIDLCKMDIRLTPLDGVSSRLVAFPEDKKKTEEKKPTLKAEDFKVSLKDLTNNPNIPIKLAENNVLFVEDFSIPPFSCGTISLKLLGRDLLLNACRENDIIKTKLNIQINETTVLNLDFFVKKDVELANTLTLTENTIHDHTRPDIKD